MAITIKPSIKSGFRKLRNVLLILIALGLILFVGIRYYYPFGEGVKTGQLNYVVYKGILFKTYEGKLIQSGFQSNKPGAIQSNEFNFSISDPQIADSLMRVGGQIVELRYKEYFGALPWRGYSNYIVYEIVSITPVNSPAVNNYPPAAAVFQ
ncbi:hypothetical protein M2459_001902 [Parabacteroides sp. PF5-5]|uniref:hypothetical protein n=1 Tax=unclassified Parabacteroides TaxID=2649774 RepID=UPI00247530FD|nr:MULTISPECIES: hypothetical protein [unclassified Parabacteroides]MDH6305449.1 hypothetical protein [Parabacteroides sp. PH5-39]MDH6316159.1 hypothetical protein [Parabacteroides sp. PF5-13]MDH6320309.1 hypothetical protein [Parabacteroides sp. PH5-13]MDH6324039.1 hypothetical protein [Parabacteroides sp. PH5-8]MDH6327350.1 hypothetical protein [Parabacteroides sp. PH5-41]